MRRQSDFKCWVVVILLVMVFLSLTYPAWGGVETSTSVVVSPPVLTDQVPPHPGGIPTPSFQVRVCPIPDGVSQNGAGDLGVNGPMTTVEGPGGLSLVHLRRDSYRSPDQDLLGRLTEMATEQPPLF